MKGTPTNGIVVWLYPRDSLARMDWSVELPGDSLVLYADGEVL